MNKELLLQAYRINNLSLRYSFVNKLYEIVKWQPNPYYGKEDEYEYDQVEQSYCKGNIHISKSCFENKETCFVVAFVELNRKEEPDIRIVGSRLLDLTNDEYMDFKKIMRYAYYLLEDVYIDDFEEFLESREEIKTE